MLTHEGHILTGSKGMPALGPFTDHGEVDVDDGGDKVLVLAADHHGVLDIWAEAEPALDILGRVFHPRSQLTHVLYPVKEDEVSPFRDMHRVPGAEPAL